MSLTAFQRVRRMQQVEAMKPENIEAKNEEIEKEEKTDEATIPNQLVLPPEELEALAEKKNEEPKNIEEKEPTTRRRRRN